MTKHVKFTSTVNCPSITLLIVKVNGAVVSTGTMTTSFEKDLNSPSLRIEYDIAASNGSGYSITYACTSDGAPKQDPAKPSPVTGKVSEFNGKIELLDIAL